MPHAGYMLNPGDMFSIDPILVMRGIGGKLGDSLYTQRIRSPPTTYVPPENPTDGATIAQIQAQKQLQIQTKDKYPNYKIYSRWKPKDYMNLFAYIPRYLEVNHNICHAVYLRHPVARSGGTEIPNPFPEDIMHLAFNWYLRRR
jgi:ribosomal protein S4